MTANNPTATTLDGRPVDVCTNGTYWTVNPKHDVILLYSGDGPEPVSVDPWGEMTDTRLTEDQYAKVRARLINCANDRADLLSTLFYLDPRD